MKELIAVGVCLTTWGILFFPFFKGPERLIEAVKLALKFDIISLFTGGWHDEMKEETRFWLYIGLGVGAGVASYRIMGGTPWFE